MGSRGDTKFVKYHKWESSYFTFPGTPNSNGATHMPIWICRACGSVSDKKLTNSKDHQRCNIKKDCNGLQLSSSREYDEVMKRHKWVVSKYYSKGMSWWCGGCGTEVKRNKFAPPSGGCLRYNQLNPDCEKQAVRNLAIILES